MKPSSFGEDKRRAWKAGLGIFAEFRSWKTASSGFHAGKCWRHPLRAGFCILRALSSSEPLSCSSLRSFLSPVNRCKGLKTTFRTCLSPPRCRSGTEASLLSALHSCRCACFLLEGLCRLGQPTLSGWICCSPLCILELLSLPRSARKRTGSWTWTYLWGRRGLGLLSGSCTC